MVQPKYTRLEPGALLTLDPCEVRTQLTWVPRFDSTSVQAITSSWGGLLEVQEVASKKDSPAIIPTLFKEDSVKWTKQGRPAKTEAESFTALIFDFDLTASVPEWKKDKPTRFVEAEDIENWLSDHGLAGIYWTTWKSQPGALRWRLVLPLDAPYAAKAHEEAWAFWAKRLEASVGLIDWAPRLVTSLHALPAIPKSRVVGVDGWGGMTPNPIFVEGSLLSLHEAEQKANLHHYANSLKRNAARKGEGWARSKGAQITPYVGNAEASHNPQTLALWAETRGSGPGTTDFDVSLDAIASLRVRGLDSKKGSKQGSVLYAAWWNLFRMGFPLKYMITLLEPVVDNAGPKYIAEFLAHSKYFSKLDDSPWFRKALEVTADVPTQPYRAAFEQFLRIFARAQHISSKKGGQMAMDQIAKLLGISKKHCVFWRCQLEERGLLIKTGEELARRYFLAGVN